MRREWSIHLALFAVTAAVYWSVGRCQFVNYDDAQYVTDNAHIRQGVTLANVGWAFHAIVGGNWHPVTCLSHMLDCQWFGLNAGAHHRVSLLFHAVNVLLLFQVLRRMTGEVWPSALVAALFAWHPLHVESVAWVSERKDVLSGFFGLLTLAAYAGCAQNKNPKSRIPGRWLALGFFALGLMSKPMLVTLPFVMLLLDFWPLGRVPSFTPQVTGVPIPAGKGASPSPPSSARSRQLQALGHLVREKAPFFALAAASSVTTFIVQQRTGAVIPEDYVPFSWRVGNALVSYVRYLGKTIWPDRLTVLYVHPFAWPAGLVFGSAVLLGLITLAAAWQARRRPFLIVGWLWFLGTLVPVIGLVQVGNQVMADRYSYLPSIGLFVMIAWGAKDFAGHWQRKNLVAAGATVALAGCLALTSLQVRYWKNSETLWRHALEVAPRNIVAYCNLGTALTGMGRIEEGLAALNEALRLRPNLISARCAMADALSRQGKARESLAQLRVALRYQPDLPDVLNNVAWTLATNPDPGIRNGAEAVRLAEHACDLTHYERTIFIGTLAAAYAEAGRFDEAIRTAERACASATAARETGLAGKNRQLLELYRARKPYRETTRPAAPWKEP
jgi:hypothetical protein